MLSGSTSGMGRENANQEFGNQEPGARIQEPGGGGRIGVSACKWTEVDVMDEVEGRDRGRERSR